MFWEFWVGIYTISVWIALLQMLITGFLWNFSDPMHVCFNVQINILVVKYSCPAGDSLWNFWKLPIITSGITF